MFTTYYATMFGLSLVMTLIYAYLWHKHFDIHFTLIFILITISNLGSMIANSATTLDGYLTGQKIIYIGGCYLILVLMLSVFSLCHIPMPHWCRALLFTLSSVFYASVLTIGTGSKLFYTGAAVIGENPLRVAKYYGPMHSAFYCMIFILFFVSCCAIAYGRFFKKNVSPRIAFMLAVPLTICVFSYFINRLFPSAEVELIPACYVATQFAYLFIVQRVNLYDINDSAIDSLTQKGETGFFSFDFKMRYLGSNQTARKIFPFLNDLMIDQKARDIPEIESTVVEWLKDFTKDERKNRFRYNKGDKVYLVDTTYLYSGHRQVGYQFFLTDDTKNQQLISMMERYNSDLQEEVRRKTANVLEMQDKLIMSMSVMVESRDIYMVGHIRRTSEVIRLIADEMLRDESCKVSADFCRDLVKAAPMHDLGKIAVEDAILRKPGRFTPEEYERMKIHTVEGARLVHEVLNGTVIDREFHRIAENMAHYHHERWDGSGYPEGRHGRDIPLEARIMAIADVYDALVSERVYKAKMTFQQADAIIREGMGHQFDKSLEQYYLKARPKIEEFYRNFG